MVAIRETTESRRDGAVVIWVVLFLTIIVGIVAINLDGGRVMEERRRAQSTADAAALAAGADLYANYWTRRGLDTAGTARAAAERIAVANGYPASAITVSIPPQNGTFAGQPGHVEVLLSTSLDASFGKIFTGSGLPVTASSVARGEPLKIGIIALRSTGADAFRNDSLAFALINKPLIVNSSHPTAFHQASPGVFIASRVDVTGGSQNSGGAVMLARIRTDVRPTLDPLAFLPIPSGGAVRSNSPMTINSILPTILQPGIYRGGLRVTGLSVVVMLPGVYIMEGGGFQVDGAATVTALEVLVYNTTSAAFPAGPIRVACLGKFAMIAPLSGTYQGLNFFQNRSLTQPVTITGAGLTTITGTIYAARAAANVSGSAAVGLDILGGAYVVDSMRVGGIGAVTIDLKLNPPRVPDVRVVE